jgi:hypothetical protein
MPIAATLDMPELVIIGLVIGGMLVAAFLLREFRDFRKNAAAEIMMQIQAQQKPEKMEIQSPLSIKAHVDCTPLTDHESLKGDFEKLREQRRIDVSGLHTKIEKAIEAVRKDVASEIREVGKEVSRTREELVENTTKTEVAAAAVTTLSGKMDSFLQEILRKRTT